MNDFVALADAVLARCSPLAPRGRQRRTPRIIWPTVAAAAVLCALVSPVYASDALDARTRDALLAAIADENHAEAYYRAVTQRFGDVAPFTKIVAAEERHATELEQLCHKYGVEVGPRASESAIPVPDTLAAACSTAVEAEQKNAAMYDSLLTTIEQPDIRETFERLRTASLERHIPAFARCAGPVESSRAGAQAEPPTCGSCGMGAACGCASASPAEQKARAAAGGGCGCAKARRQAQGSD